MGGVFAVSNARILALPKRYFEDLLLEFPDGEIDPEVGHFFERAWYYLFTGAGRATVALREVPPIAALTVWTDNYQPLFDRWKSTLPSGFEPFAAKIVSTNDGVGFGTEHWFDCIKRKIAFFIGFLEDWPEGRIVLCSDADIMFVSPAGDLASLVERAFARRALDVWIMRENASKMVNGGFYFVRNSARVRAFLALARDSCDERLPFGDQTFINAELGRHLTWDYIPTHFVAWGNHVFDPRRCLFHHAVCASFVDLKTKQQENILKYLERQRQKILSAAI
jgi:hypothetical protein